MPVARHRTAVRQHFTAAMRRDYAAVRDGTANEAQFQRVVVAYAKDHGWLCHHTPRAKVRPGQHVTPTVGHVGFPDLVLVRDGRCLFVELKAKGGSPSDEQTVWHNRLADCSGVEAYLWWVRSWLTITETLR